MPINEWERGGNCAKHGSYTDGVCPICETERTTRARNDKRRRGNLSNGKKPQEKGSTFSTLVTLAIIVVIGLYFFG